MDRSEVFWEGGWKVAFARVGFLWYLFDIIYTQHI